MRTYRETKRDIAVANDSHPTTYLPCCTCNGSTPVEILAQYGARCQPCYNAFCAEKNPSWWPNRSLTRDELDAVIRKAAKGMKMLGAKPNDPEGLGSRDRAPPCRR